MLNLRRLQDKKILASAKHSEIDTESEGKVLNLRQLQNRKIFVTSERSSATATAAIMAIGSTQLGVCVRQYKLVLFIYLHYGLTGGRFQARKKVFLRAVSQVL